jgi:7,8-dihydropterin-6-yl-methyl-4-(beta-D-ribofuranosyl)aminobenzene 5'-phosphate synthase
VTRLGADLGAVGAMVLSHGHWDHGGAMPRALQMITQENGGKNVPVYMHPEMFALRATKSKDGGFFPMEKVPTVDVLAGCGGDVVVTRDEQSVLGEAFFISGEIPRVTPFERGMPGQHRQAEDGSWIKDELLPDERFVVAQQRFDAGDHGGLRSASSRLRRARSRPRSGRPARATARARSSASCRRGRPRGGRGSRPA